MDTIIELENIDGKDFRLLVDEYLNSEIASRESNAKKAQFFQLASSLDRSTLRGLRNQLSDEARASQGKTKRLLYELSAGLYNLTPVPSWDTDTTPTLNPQGGDVIIGEGLLSADEEDIFKDQKKSYI